MKNLIDSIGTFLTVLVCVLVVLVIVCVMCFLLNGMIGLLLNLCDFSIQPSAAENF